MKFYVLLLLAPALVRAVPLSNSVRLSYDTFILPNGNKLNHRQGKLELSNKFSHFFSQLTFTQIKEIDQQQIKNFSGILGYGLTSFFHLAGGYHMQQLDIKGVGDSNHEGIAGFYLKQKLAKLFFYKGNGEFLHLSYAFVTNLYRPLELNLTYEKRKSSVDTLNAGLNLYLSSHYGITSGYEVINPGVYLGFWINYTNKIIFSSQFQITRQRNDLFQLSIRYLFAKKTEIVFKKKNVQRQKKKPVRKQVSPDFRTLIRWGISPQVALKISRSKKICKVDQYTKRILAKHNWVCWQPERN